MTTTKTKLIDVINYLPDTEIDLLFEIAVRFADDVATADDLDAIRQSEAEYAAGETVSHNAINWD